MWTRGKKRRKCPISLPTWLSGHLCHGKHHTTGPQPALLHPSHWTAVRTKGKDHNFFTMETTAYCLAYNWHLTYFECEKKKSEILSHVLHTQRMCFQSLWKFHINSISAELDKFSWAGPIKIKEQCNHPLFSASLSKELEVKLRSQAALGDLIHVFERT